MKSCRIIYVFLPKIEHREQALREFNIEDFLVSQTWHENQIFYRIGIQGSDHYALIDPKTFSPITS